MEYIITDRILDYNEPIESAETVSSVRLFQTLTILWEKKCYLESNLGAKIFSFLLWPLVLDESKTKKLEIGVSILPFKML